MTRLTRPIRLIPCIALLAFGCLYDTGELYTQGPIGPPTAEADPPPFATGVPIDPILALRFDRHLDPFAVYPSAAVRLSSGRRQVELEVSWDPVDRAVYAIPTKRLTPGVRYVFEVVDPDLLPDLTGRTLDADAVEALRTPFTVDEEGVERSIPTDGIDLTDPEAAFRRYVVGGPGACAGCHTAGALYPNTDLALDDLDEVKRRQAKTSPERKLVVAGQPARSYLLHKLLFDYPDIGGEPMPLGIDMSDSDRRNALRATQAWIQSLSGL
jgi:hypothetical protein